MKDSAENIQAAYYERVASVYDEAHNADEDHEHTRALGYINLMSDALQLNSFLDVGAGTGRGVRFLLDHGKDARGVEPVPALIAQAEATGIPAGLIVEGNGYNLPFSDNSFDVVLECGMLHHVAEPSRVVAEMIRVARRAVFISDSNRFGQGKRYTRFLKLALYKLGVWRAARFLQTGGKMYTISDGDGLGYSYSVFDSYSQVAAQSRDIWLLPIDNESCQVQSWAHPLLTCPHVLLCAFKDSAAIR